MNYIRFSALGRMVLPLLFTGISLAGCEKPVASTPEDNQTTAATGGSAQPEASGGPKTQSVPEDKRSRFNKFPYVELAGGKSLRFEAFDIVFQLTHEKPLFPMTNDQVKWIKEGDADQNMGNFITYVYEGHEVDLSNPYISVQYFARNNEDCPECKTPEKVLNAFQKMYQDRPGFKATPTMEVATNEGKIAYCKEMYIPSIQLPGGAGSKTEKYIGYAYVEYSEKWMIGFALTTGSKAEYERCKNPFFNLVSTYAELKNFQKKK